MPYTNEAKNGIEKWYSDNGEVIATISYKNDEMIEGKCKNGKQLTNAHLHRIQKEGLIESGICK